MSMAGEQGALGVREAECPSDQTMAAYFDGTLSAEDVARVENHAADCERCLEFVAEMAHTVARDS
jgi:anti-sigma factor RsiW